ncbi:cupin domain-containing protein [Arthrobacter psychrochitiniphilus]|uniref:cupin domain-containing protein n=1 Tax=Arthrobacter psychrochitiniphilus TaxID=291045 RepID=UPI003F7C8C64
MSMRITKIEDAEPFQPAGHEGVGPVRLQGGESTPTTNFTVVFSHYLPGGAAELAPQEAETVYVVISGELVMNSEGNEQVLGPYDSVHFEPGTLRTVLNKTNLPASMLVIRATT